MYFDEKKLMENGEATVAVDRRPQAFHGDFLKARSAGSSFLFRMLVFIGGSPSHQGSFRSSSLSPFTMLVSTGVSLSHSRRVNGDPFRARRSSRAHYSIWSETAVFHIVMVTPLGLELGTSCLIRLAALGYRLTYAHDYSRSVFITKNNLILLKIKGITIAMISNT